MLGLRSPYQWSLFLCMYVGYMLFIFCRRSFSFVIPTVIEKDGLETSEIGGVLSSFALAYSIGKFINGILVDKFSPKWLFASGLFSCGLFNLLFSFADSYHFGILWFLNGLCQGPGWPACAKILQRWYSPVVFGSLWSILSTSMNVPASVGPLMSSFVTDQNNGNWRLVLKLCGSAACGFAAVCFLTLKDKPEDVGLSLSALTDYTPPHVEDVKVNSQTAKNPVGSTWRRIFSSPYTYVVSLGYLVSLFLKGVVSDWSQLYLIQEKNATKFLAGTFIGVVEVGGFVGSILSGIFSDRLVAYLGSRRKGNPRHYWIIGLHIGLLSSLLLMRLAVLDAAQQQFLSSFVGFAIGFCVYGLLNLMGVLAVENSSSDISGTAHAFCSLIGNCGLMSAGLPFSILVDSLSWNVSLQCCELLVAISMAGFMLSQFLRCHIGDRAKLD